MKRILLHICCGPCGTASLRRLREMGEVTLFYSNSNIFPESEYRMRLAEVERLAEITGCELVLDTYDHANWRAFVRGLEDEPEKGRRCLKCFEYNLSRAAVYARANDFDALTTTLTVSPHKVSRDIFSVGSRVCDCFLEVDFKKRDGFRQSIELSKRYGMYRQGYCGCEFSLRDRHSGTCSGT